MTNAWQFDDSDDEEDNFQQNIRTVLELMNFNEPTVRANAIIALGNLAGRYPNILEPLVAKLFLVLGDTDKSVQKQMHP
jgi:non-SMC mitotic condensation complex subunit 1